MDTVLKQKLCREDKTDAAQKKIGPAHQEVELIDKGKPTAKKAAQKEHSRKHTEVSRMAGGSNSKTALEHPELANNAQVAGERDGTQQKQSSAEAKLVAMEARDAYIQDKQAEDSIAVMQTLFEEKAKQEEESRATKLAREYAEKKASEEKLAQHKKQQEDYDMSRVRTEEKTTATYEKAQEHQDNVAAEKSGIVEQPKAAVMMRVAASRKEARAAALVITQEARQRVKAAAEEQRRLWAMRSHGPTQATPLRPVIPASENNLVTTNKAETWREKLKGLISTLDELEGTSCNNLPSELVKQENARPTVAKVEYGAAVKWAGKPAIGSVQQRSTSTTHAELHNTMLIAKHGAMMTQREAARVQTTQASSSGRPKSAVMPCQPGQSVVTAAKEVNQLASSPGDSDDLISF